VKKIGCKSLVGSTSRSSDFDGFLFGGEACALGLDEAAKTLDLVDLNMGLAGTLKLAT